MPAKKTISARAKTTRIKKRKMKHDFFLMFFLFYQEVELPSLYQVVWSASFC